MNGLVSAVVELASFLDSQSVPYMVIGGIANLQWGIPRLTQDVDVTVRVPDSDWKPFIDELTRRYQVLPDDPLEFARSTRVLPVTVSHGIRADLIFAALPFEDEALRRAVLLPLEGGSARVCTAEDLVLHKILSDRPRDMEDVEGILIRQGVGLDLTYLTPRVRELAVGLERPDILERLSAAIKKAGLLDA